MLKNLRRKVQNFCYNLGLFRIHNYSSYVKSLLLYSQNLECLTKLIVTPKTSIFVSGKEGEAGHPMMVDAA